MHINKTLFCRGKIYYMKRAVYSRYSAGESVIVKHTCHKFAEGEVVTVVDPKKVKYRKNYVITVENAHGESGKIPTKLIKMKSVKQKLIITKKSA